MHASYKWIILFGSFLVYLFDALEISVLSFALPTISHDFALTLVVAGVLFLLAACLMFFLPRTKTDKMGAEGSHTRPLDEPEKV